MVETSAFDEIVDFLSTYQPEKILNFHPSEATQERVEWLLERKHSNKISNKEQNELQHFLMLEHIIRLAKSKALKKIHG